LPHKATSASCGIQRRSTRNQHSQARCAYPALQQVCDKERLGWRGHKQLFRSRIAIRSKDIKVRMTAGRLKKHFLSHKKGGSEGETCSSGSTEKVKTNDGPCFPEISTFMEYSQVGDFKINPY